MLCYFMRVSMLLVIFGVIVSSKKLKTCTFKYDSDFPEKESVLLWNNYLLLKPEHNVVTLNAGDEIIVACPGYRNSLVEIGQKIAFAKCVSGQSLKIGFINYLLKDLKCAYLVTANFKVTTKTCASYKGIIIQIGYLINENFIELFNVCYDKNNSETLYTDHVIFGSAVDYTKSTSIHKNFSAGDIISDVNSENAYNTTDQLHVLTKLLGSKELSNKYITSDSYLVKGLLVSDADQVYVTLVLNTYFYINTIPQWYQISNGNWKSMEINIRKAASILNENFQVITGVWGVLQLEDINGNLVDVYLSEGKLPVPKFVWKVVYSLETFKAIAFININNPFLKEITEEDYICKDICDIHGWGNSTWMNPAKGFIYCCDVDELRAVVNIIPNFHIIDVLEGPSIRKLLRKLFEM